MGRTLEQIIEDGEGTIKRYRSYYGGDPIPGGETVWEVEFDPFNERYTLRHYNTPLVHWRIVDGKRRGFLSWYSIGSFEYLTNSDRRGINLVDSGLLRFHASEEE